MSGREPPRRSDPDDWFADPDRLSWGSTTAVEPPAAPREESDANEDWLYGEPAAAPPDRASAGFTIKLGTLLVVAAVVVVLLALAGLWLGGVFSGGGNHPATSPPTTASTTTTSQTPTTTPTTPTRPALPAPTSTLKPGDQGVQVKRLQRALVRLGYAIGAVDGDYGPSTQAALTRFQKATKLNADGVLGPKTLQALKQALRELP
jgi:Putative peptidoglycan binding domain